MRVPLAWLRDYVELPPDVDAIVTKLATLGFPADSVETRPVISGVVAGTIVKLERHPDADRLSVCTIDVGAVAPVTILTAAENVTRELVVPVALIGAQLPQLKIAPRKMRGIESQGMLCSAQELGLPAEWFEDGILHLDAQIPNGTDVVEYFGLDLPVLDIDVGANRGDALSLIGIARELAAGTGAQLRFPPLAPPANNAGAAPSGAARDAAGVLRVTLESVDVRRYIVQRISDVRVGRAPVTMRVRLALAGQRPISNLVDVSNFVMLELGQPLHFFDAQKISGLHLIVRDARPHERLTTLDGIERELGPSALVNADDDGPTGLAGLMGGLRSEVSETTREIVIESANFAGPRIRRMSLDVGLRTEASTRNEKNLPPALTDLGTARAAHLLGAEGAVIHAPQAYGKPLEPPATIELTQHDVERLLGFTVSAPEIRQALEALGFGLRPLEHNGSARFAVTVPVWRSDVAIAADLVEEVARIVGYDRVRAELPPIAPQTLDSTAFEREMSIAQTLVGLGYFECITLALQPVGVAERWRSLGLDVPPVVEIRNPLSEDQRWMRFSLLPALLEHAARERSVRPLRTFEIGHVFADAPAAPREANVVGTLATTKAVSGQPPWRDAAFLEASSDIRSLVRALTGRDARLERGSVPGLHPGKTARVWAGDVEVGFVGTVDPRLLRAAELMTDDAVAALLFIDELPPRAARHYEPISKYPPVERDLAIILDPAVSAAQVVTTVRSSTPIVRGVEVFDEYRGPQIAAGKKSLAIRIILQRDDATLTDNDADAALQRILAALRSDYGATVRG